MAQQSRPEVKVTAPTGAVRPTAKPPVTASPAVPTSPQGKVTISPAAKGVSNQEIVWTALPNGTRPDRTARGKYFLQVSVFIAPRLRVQGGIAQPNLSRFKDFADWPERVRALEFSLDFGTGSPIKATKVSEAPDSELWKALFTGSSKVESFEMPNYVSRPLLDYPVRNIEDFIKNKYSEISANPKWINTPPTHAELAHEDMFGKVALAPRPVDVAAVNLGGVAPANRTVQLHQTLAQELALRKTIAPRSRPDAELDFTQFAMFHAPVDVARYRVKPPDVDFHKVLSSVAKYPKLMRRLGLVVDLEIEMRPGIAQSGTLRAIPQWGSYKPEGTSRCPRTAYAINGSAFFAAPKPGSQDIENGMLKLSGDQYEISCLDVDGAAMKAMELANKVTAAITIPDTAKLQAPAPLPSLRTGGISVARDGRAEETMAKLMVAAKMYTSADGGAEATLYADDLMRGVRVDVWDSTSGKWNSLCRRLGTYKFLSIAKQVELEDEGFVSSAVTKAPEDGSTDPTMRLHQAMFQWNGWSLCAPRPGKTITMEDKPGVVDTEPPEGFRLKTSFDAVKGSLPKLRFGRTYRIRARVVDLAGNSLGFDEPDPRDFGMATRPLTYTRFEPVTSPIVVLRVDPKGGQAAKKPATTQRPGGPPISAAEPVEWGSPGESVERLVIRSFNDTPAKDTVAATQRSDRHVAPPKTSQLVAERHSLFDAPGGMDKQAYGTIIARDGMLKDIEPAEQLALPYLPDPLALGASFSGLPGTVGARTVEFYPQAAWPEARAFRILITEGVGQPQWDAAKRVLVVPLPKAEIVQVQLSCYMKPESLKPMGIWHWLEQAAGVVHDVVTPIGPATPVGPTARPVPNQGPKVRLPKMNIASSARPTARPAQSHTVVPSVAAGVAQSQAAKLSPAALSQIQVSASQGLHWMLSPARTLTLVHAVQQPLIIPEPNIGCYRSLGDTRAFMVGTVQFHGKSTSSIDLKAEWSETIDPISKPKPETISGKAHVFQQQVQYEDTKFEFKGKPHEFHDTKYRKVRYNYVVTTRFKEYFPPIITRNADNITRTSQVKELNVLSSARPAAPKVLYVVPTFAWEEPKKIGNSILRKRNGGGLRVYMERPWYSSGDGELLGVVLVPQGGKMNRPPSPPPEHFKPYVTLWGFDPLWDAKPLLTSIPLAEQFKAGVQVGKNLSIAELPETEDPNGLKVAVVGHNVQYDEQRQLWFCDIDLDPGAAYFPFVRLALARYQPKSIDNTHLSRIFLADYSQLVPTRTAIVVRASATSLKVSVNGPAYSATELGPGTSEMEATVEMKQPGVDEAFAWVPIENGTARMKDSPYTALSTAWNAEFSVPDATPGKYRIVFREYERFKVDGDRPVDVAAAMVRPGLNPDIKARPNAPINTGSGQPSTAIAMPGASIPASTDRRLVYADAIVLD